MPEAYVQDSLLHVYNLRFLPCCYYDRKLFLLKKHASFQDKAPVCHGEYGHEVSHQSDGKALCINTFLQLLCL